VYVSKIGGHRQAPAPSRIGGRMPLHCTAIGKALLAHAGDELVARVVGGGLERRTPHTITAPGLLRRQLASSRETGVAYEREESMLGLLCVAAPVLDRDDRPLAAISLAGRVGRFRPEKHLLQLRAAAGGVAATLARREELIGPLDP
jgi:DNA-binding IclR family transcriptional regulator